jgi:hypothetical protein
MRDNFSERLFSLFTSSDRAVAIAGDLMEEREQHGSIWFWLHVVRITLALWRDAAMEAPLRVLALATVACALFTAPAFGGAAAVGLFPQLMGSPVSWIALSFFWWGGALWVGASLVAIAPRCGMAACATLALGSEVLLIGVGIPAGWRDQWSTDFLLFYTTGLLVPALLLAGGAIARRRLVNGVVVPQEQHR